MNGTRNGWRVDVLRVGLLIAVGGGIMGIAPARAAHGEPAEVPHSHEMSITCAQHISRWMNTEPIRMSRTPSALSSGSGGRIPELHPGPSCTHQNSIRDMAGPYLSKRMELEMHSVRTVTPSDQTVEVAVVDTVDGQDSERGGRGAGDGLPFHGPPGHGRSVGLLIHKMACPEEVDSRERETHCPTRITYLPGLQETGGGTQQQLAAAICLAVDERRSSRLIINLSLGWEVPSTFFNTTPNPVHLQLAQYRDEDLEVPERAVKEALRYAACTGALVVAASGNGRGRDGVVRYASLPAAWEREASPEESDCRAMGLHGPVTERLVYAVGGLQGTDPLVPIRSMSMPRLAAPGFQVVTHDMELRQYAPVLTGTSMSAAAVSGAAALVWSRQPTLGAVQVMETLYGTAEPLGMNAEFCAYEHCMVKRVSVARAVAHMGGAGLPVTAQHSSTLQTAKEDFVAQVKAAYPVPHGSRVFNPQRCGCRDGCPAPPAPMPIWTGCESCSLVIEGGIINAWINTLVQSPDIMTVGLVLGGPVLDSTPPVIPLDPQVLTGGSLFIQTAVATGVTVPQQARLVFKDVATDEVMEQPLDIIVMDPQPR